MCLISVQSWLFWPKLQTLGHPNIIYDCTPMYILVHVFKIEIFLNCVTNIFNMPEDKIRVSARIPKDLYDICLQRYDNITNAVNAGLELLCSQSKDEAKTHEDKRQQNEDDSSKALIEEKDRHIETLRKELEKAGQDKEAIQNLYNNYMLQMQTLINQKALEAPGAKKQWWRFW